MKTRRVGLKPSKFMFPFIIREDSAGYITFIKNRMHYYRYWTGSGLIFNAIYQTYIATPRNLDLETAKQIIYEDYKSRAETA